MTTDRKTRVAELADEHGPLVYAVAYRILGNPDDAADALQDVFLKVLRDWGRGLQPDLMRNWGAWLRVTATRSAIDLLRRRGKQRSRTVLIDDAIVDGAIVDKRAADPRRSAIERQQLEQLRTALGRLPTRQAQMFTLRFFEDYSYEQIAEATGLSVRKVGVLLFRARGRLRQILAPLAQPNEVEQAPLPPAKEKKHATG